MQIIDYTKKLRRFNTLELSVLDALIKEYLEKDSLFDFLKEIDLTNTFDILWYYDSNAKAMAGYHMLMDKAIYVACNFCGGEDPKLIIEKDGYDMFAVTRVIIMFSSIIHEAYHYYQHKYVYKSKFILLQLPIIRDFTIEKEAYAISDYIDKLNIIEKFTQIREFLFKIKYNFQESYFFTKNEKTLRKIFIQQKLNPANYWNYEGVIKNLIEELEGN